MMYDIILLYYVGYGLGKPQKAPTPRAYSDSQENLHKTIIYTCIYSVCTDR